MVNSGAMKKPWQAVAVALFIAALAGGGLVGDRVLALTDDTRDSLRAYTDLVSLAHERYGGEVSYRDLVHASIQGMLRTLDPHTSFLPPRAYSGMRERQQSSFYGLGILVGVRNSRLTVISPIEGTPASRQGMRAGDVIETIEDEPTGTMTLDEAVDRLKGPKGTPVRISLVRPGLEQPLELTIIREEIPQTTVRLTYMLDPVTGYMQISDFGRGTGEEVATAIAALRAQGMERLLVDLRNNGGGLLDQAIEVADQFLPDGARIVETKGRTRDSYQTFRATGRYEDLGLPVIMLVNRGTASAAEILSGAVQDHDIGLVIGTPTWGKGLVQTVYSLSYGAGLALTTAKYYTPSGRLIQRDYSSFYDYYNYDPLADVGRSDTPDDVRPEPPYEGQAPEDRDPGKGVPPSEVFHTDLGREVYGGGGITPDVVVELEEIGAFEQFLLARSAYFGFAVRYTNGHDTPEPSWQPPAGMLEEFEDWVVAEGMASEAEVAEGMASEAAREFALLQIHAEVFNSAYGQEARHRVLVGGDAQIREALGLFEKAGDLLAQRRALEAPGRRASLPAEASSDG
jgi:carboxyl-terminal processing protease